MSVDLGQQNYFTARAVIEHRAHRMCRSKVRAVTAAFSSQYTCLDVKAPLDMVSVEVISIK
jgi:hypothetical protein